MMTTPITNAWLDDGLTLRVGVPHFNGALPAHCADEDVPVMVSAGAFWRPERGSFVEPGKFGWSTDACNVALDSAGFVAMKHWAGQGPQPGMKGVYPWSLEQYMALVCDVWPRWYSQPDACVEPEIAADESAIRRRVAMTAELLEETLNAAWDRALLMRGHFRPCVPVVQGWRDVHYRESLERALEIWDRCTAGTDFERTPTLIGVGSVCRRHLHHPEHGLFRVLDAIGDLLPSGTKLHLFGVKSAAARSLHNFPVASVDSMAWDFGSRVAARKAGASNTMTHRIGHLERWRASQAAHLDAARRQPTLFAAGGAA